MPEPDPKIAELEKRLDQLVRTQVSFQLEVNLIRSELARLRGPTATTARLDPVPPPQPRPAPPIRYTPPPQGEDTHTEPPREIPPPTFGASYTKTRSDRPSQTSSKMSDYFATYTDSAKADLEKFIGENLISKIGILVLIIGVGIGAKYAIDNDLISPLTRIVLGYIMGAGLLAMAVKLKPKYHNFSAVLLSGGMAIMYFLTYFAYATYQLMPQSAAFVVMVMFTLFTVTAAIVYDRQVIAHIGLVGAYAVPFLVSTNSGNYLFLFIYMAILNAGILAISVKRAWTPIFYTASTFTWLIFVSWLASRYASADHLNLALTFLGIFFAIFYTTKIVHGLFHSQIKDPENIASMIITAVIFYGCCIAISDGASASVEFTVIFSYLAAISLALLISSFRFYGRVLVFVTYPFTWLIFGAWFLNKYSADQHLALAAIFASVFFTVFYGATLVYRLATDEIGMAESAGLVLTNSLIFYGFGYAIMDSHAALQPYQGVFTVGHAAFHSLVAQAVDRVKPYAVDVVQVLAVLIVTFATAAVPIQFDGNLVTVIWSVEAVVLFYFGRGRGIVLFEYFSYPLMFLASCSMLLDWFSVYSDRSVYSLELASRPFANGEFVTGLVFVAAFAFIYMLNADDTREPAIDRSLIKPMSYLVAVIAVSALYNTFRMEIGNFFHLEAVSRGLSNSLNILGGPRSTSQYDLGRFNIVTQIDYTMLFLTTLAVVNIRKVRSWAAAYAGIGLSVLTLMFFVLVGLYLLYELRQSYLNGATVELFGFAASNVAIRYLSYLFVAGLLATIFKYSSSELTEGVASPEVRVIGFDAVLYPTALIMTSCELMNISAHLGVNNADKYGLSILWGVFALMLIAIGIGKRKKHLRIAAIVLLAVTLAKLFFYDITDLGTIPKTILFVLLGLLMLVMSFLYNKYKDIIFGKESET